MPKWLPKREFKLVILESPFAACGKIDEHGKHEFTVEDNIRFARACVKDCLDRGESAYASHLFFTQDGILDDNIPEERDLGIRAGFAWRDMAEKTVVYIDRGVSKGMWKGIFHAQELPDHEVEFRFLEKPNWRKEK